MCSNEAIDRQFECDDNFEGLTSCKSILLSHEATDSNKAFVIMIDENGNPYGKLKSKFYLMNHFQRVLYNNSFNYRCSFFEPIEIILK